jgi:hypothetical protein
MPARSLILIGAALAALSLAACTPKSDKTGDAGDQTPRGEAAQIAAALDPCAEGSGADPSLCGNRALAALDEQIRDALVAEAASVSADGADVLVQNEQRWRQAQRVACGVADATATPDAAQQSCLEAEFRQRVQDARSSIEEVGGYTFQRVELVDATPVTAQVAAESGLGDEAPPAISRNIRYPRIDAPQTPAIQRFNQLVAQQPQYRLEDATEEVVDYRIAYAGPDVISVRFDTSDFSLGAAHPNSSSKAVTVMMGPGRALAATDVFRAGSGWEQFVTTRATRELTRQFREYDFTPSATDVRENATKPHLWLVTEDGLVILFPPYSFGGPYALGGTAEVTIPWAELRTYLNPNAPAPIRVQA